MVSKLSNHSIFLALKTVHEKLFLTKDDTVIERQSESQGNEGGVDNDNDNVDLIAFDNESQPAFMDGGKFTFDLIHCTKEFCSCILSKICSLVRKNNFDYTATLNIIDFIRIN